MSGQGGDTSMTGGPGRRMLTLLAGMLASFLYLIGRWVPFRDKDAVIFLQPRFWLLAFLLLFAALLALGRAGRPHRGETAMPDRLLLTSVALFLFYAALSILWAPDIHAGLPKFLDTIVVLLTVAAFRYLRSACGRSGFTNAFWGSLLLAAALLAVVVLATGHLASGDRVNALGGGPNVFGRIMGLLCVAALSRSLSGQRKGVMLLFAVGAVAVVSSGSRGALLAAAFGCLTLLITSRVPWRRVLLVLLLLGSVTAAAGLLTPFGQRAQEVFRQRVLVLTIAEQHDSGRAGIRARALALGRESPLFGAGLNSFAVRTGFVHPHNVFLEIFAEGGAIGLGLFLFMLAAVIGTFWKQRAALDPPSVAAFALIFVACQFSGDLYDSRGLFLFPLLALTAGTEA